MTTEPNSIVQQALEYHSLGWCIIPIPRGQKKAAIKWKRYQQTRPDQRQLYKWFDGRESNLAVVLGQVSGGLACRDFDSVNEYDLWACQYSKLASTLPTVRTSSGKHVYFIGNIEGIKHVSCGELRGSGGYCLVPGSVHPSGVLYQWLIPPTIDSLLELCPIEAGFIPYVTENTEQTEAIREWGWRG